MPQEMYFQIHLTDDCNLRCLHCYHDDKSSYTYMREAEFDYILKEALTYMKAKGLIPGTAVFCGGEPTLSPILFECIKKFRQAGFPQVSVLTNGLMITDDYARRLVEAGCTKVQICIEGNRETHNRIRNGTFDKVLKAWKICREHGLRVNNQTTLNPQNLHQINEIIEICRGRVDRTAFLRQVPHNKELDILTPDQWLKTLEGFYRMYLQYGRGFLDFVHVRDIHWVNVFTNERYMCGFRKELLNSVAIEANGDVICCRKSGVVLGNIFRESLLKINDESPILQRTRNSINLNPTCKKCSSAATCGGGCLAIANAVNGDLLAEDPQCIIRLMPPDYWNGWALESERLPALSWGHSDAIRMDIREKEIIDYMWFTGDLQTARNELTARKTAAKKALVGGSRVSDAQKQEAAETFRKDWGLSGDAGTVLWLRENGLSLEALENFLEESLLIE